MRAVALLLGLLLLTVTAVSAVPTPHAAVPLATTHDATTLAQVQADPLAGPAFGQRLAQAVRTHSGEAAFAALLHASGFDEQPLALALSADGVLARWHVDASRLGPRAAEGLATLLAGVEVAQQLRSEAVAGLTLDEQRWFVEQGFFRSLPAPAAPDQASATASASGATSLAMVASLSTGETQLDPQAVVLASKVDLAKLRTAALTILAAIDAAAPLLKDAQPVGSDAPSACGVGGSIVVEDPTCSIIVGDSTANTYNPGTAAAKALLIVDLGGDDTYNFGAGTGSLGVQVVVDASGNDAYNAPAALLGAPGTLTSVGLGAGVLGVGVLADLAGNDRYTLGAVSTAPEPGPVARPALAEGEGFGAVGVGVLLDGGGKDTVTASVSSHGGDANLAVQGAGALGGVGALLNLGDETGPGVDDTYTASATSVLHLILRDTQQSQYNIGHSSVLAQGGSTLAGVGGLVDVGGNDVYNAAGDSGLTTTDAQGGTSAGVALLVDAQGNDKYTAQALGNTTLSLITTDPSVCWTVTVTVDMSNGNAVNSVAAQGGAITGAAAFVDATGNDARSLVSQSIAGAIAEARSNFDCPSFGLQNKAVATATSAPGLALGQGAGSTGLGLLVDAADYDTNSLTTSSKALARAIAVSPGLNVESATPSTRTASTDGQGYASGGVGLLADLGGNDAYASSGTSIAVKQNSGGTTITQGQVLQSVQGSGSGVPWFLDADGSDTYTTNPAGATQARNQKCWSNAGDGKGFDWAVSSGTVCFPGLI